MDSCPADSRSDSHGDDRGRVVRVCDVPLGCQRDPAARTPAVAGVGHADGGARLAAAALASRLLPVLCTESTKPHPDPQGVYWRTITNVPRSRVQHTDVSQGPLERRFGLGTLVIYTAGTSHSKVNVSGLAFDVARRIRAHLLPDDQSDAVSTSPASFVHPLRARESLKAFALPAVVVCSQAVERLRNLRRDRGGDRRDG